MKLDKEQFRSLYSCLLAIISDLNFAEVSPYNITVTVNCPPDTDTPGFKEEERYKPLETTLMSEAAGLFKPDVVAR